MRLFSRERKRWVLFVCVENSCRSQMAEAFAKRFGKDVLEAWSAGSNPSDKVDEIARKVMQERGMELGDQRPKGFSNLPHQKWDYVVTMGCGDQCPFIPAKRRIDWDITDPKNRPLDEVRRVRDEIEEGVIALIHRAISGGL